MKLRLRIARVIILISLILVVVTLLNEGISSIRTYQATRAIIQESETETARVTASLIQHLIRVHSVGEMAEFLSDLKVNHAAEIITIASQDGKILDSWSSIRSPSPFEPAFLQSASGQSAVARWISNDKLQIAVPITISQDSQPLIVVREVDLSAEVNQVLVSIYTRIAVTLLLTILAVAGMLWINWRFAVKPMQAIARAANEATAGGFSSRLQRMPMTELDDIGQGFNSLLERTQTQTALLEDLNRELETTVSHRTAALLSANQDLELQASRLQALNRILTAAISINLLQDLAGIALVEIVTAMRAELGHLSILNAEAHFIPADQNSPQSGAPPPNLLHRSAEDNSRTELAVPIASQGTVTGRIYLRNQADTRWDEEDTSFLNLIGQQLGAAAARIQAYEQGHTTNRLMSRLIQVSERLNQQLDFEDMVAFIGSSTLDLSGAERGVFFLINPDNQLNPVWHRGVSSRFIRELAEQGREIGAFIPPGDSNPVQVPDLDLLPDRPREWWRQNGEGIRSVSILPILYEGRLNACLASFYMEPDTPGLSYPEILEAFARQAAIALENARLIEAERQQRELTEALLDVAAAFSSTLDPDEIFERILINLEHVIHHDAASIMLVEGGELNVIRTQGYPATEDQPVESFYPIELFPEVVRMSQTGLVRIIPDTRADPDWVVTPGTRWILAYAGAPVRSRGNLIGVINLIGRRPGVFTPEQAPILQAFASHAALALENAHQYQATLSNLDETDSLYRALTDLLTAGGDVPQIARKIVQTVTTHLDVGHCAVALVDREKKQLSIISSSGPIKIKNSIIPLDGPGLTPLAAREGKTIYIPDVNSDPRYLKGSDETRTEFIIPLCSTNGEVFAMINMEDNKTSAFDEKTRRTISNFAERAALVLENAGLLDAAREQSRRTALLNQIAQSCLEAANIKHSLKAIVQQAAELTSADNCRIDLWDEVQLKNTFIADWGAVKDHGNLDPSASIECTVTKTVMDRQEAVMIADTFTAGSENDHTSQYNNRSLLGMPLIADGTWLGAILIGRSLPGPFNQESIDLLHQAAVQIALGVAKIRLLEVARRRFEESEKLRQATAVLTTQLDFDRIITLIAEHLPGLLRFDTLAVFLVRQGMVRPVLAVNLPISDHLGSISFPLSDPIFLHLIQKRSPLVLADAVAESSYKNWGGHPDIRSWCALPLFSGDNVYGSIEVGRVKVDPFSANEMFLLQVFAHQVGAALQNATLHGIEQQLATTDQLTGLYNRRGFLELARHELERCWRFHRPLCVLMADIDHFKQVNDAHGHFAGDAVLTQLAKTMLSTLREVDVVCRFGGEEFCIILPESDPQGSLNVAERLRETVQNTIYLYRDIRISITISIGMSTLLGLNQTIEELIEQADSALMVAKQKGRNRVTEG